VSIKAKHMGDFFWSEGAGRGGRHREQHSPKPVTSPHICHPQLPAHHTCGCGSWWRGAAQREQAQLGTTKVARVLRRTTTQCVTSKLDEGSAHGPSHRKYTCNADGIDAFHRAEARAIEFLSVVFLCPETFLRVTPGVSISV
jgi:hypothetical protein